MNIYTGPLRKKVTYTGQGWYALTYDRDWLVVTLTEAYIVKNEQEAITCLKTQMSKFQYDASCCSEPSFQDPFTL